MASLGSRLVGNVVIEHGRVLPEQPQDIRPAPCGAIGKLHSGQGSDIGLDGDRAFILVPRQEVNLLILVVSKADIGRRDAGAKADHIIAAIPVVDDVGTIPGIEHIDVVA